MDHRLNRIDARVLGKQSKAAPDHRLARDLPILLRQIAPRSDAAAGSHDDCRDACRHPVLPFLQNRRLTASARLRPKVFSGGRKCCNAALAPTYDLAKMYAR